MLLKGPSQSPLSGDKPKSVCVMLHGVGADGDNLIDLAQPFAQDFPDTYFIAPNAPEKFSLGISGYQWFPYYDRSHPEIINGLEKSSVILSEYLIELLDSFSLTPENLVLMGFSQGAMVAIHTGLTMQDNCAGIVAFSGGLLKVDITGFEVRSQPPICLIHGDYDDVVPYQMSENAAKLLGDLNVPSEFHKLPGLGHSIDMTGIDIAKGFLQKIIK